MSAEDIQQWLVRNTRARKAGAWLGGAAALAGGFAVLFITFWIAFGAIFIIGHGVSALSQLILDHPLKIKTFWVKVLSGVFLFALLVERLRRSEFDLGSYGDVNEAPPAGSALSGVAILLANPQASSTLITELLYTGPRLLIGAANLFILGLRLGKLDHAACAWVLAYAGSSESAVEYQTLNEAWPSADWPALKKQLSLIPGVLFLAKGVTLTPELRNQLAAVHTGSR